MEKINPLLYITDTDPIPEVVLNASGWFETEYMTIEWSTLSPNNYLEWYMAQGWTMYNKETWKEEVGTPQSFTTIWYARGYLKRRKLQSERVLQSMITEFTSAYNEGRSINDQRYDEIVTLYNVMLDKSETEIGTLSTTSINYNAQVDALVALITADAATFSTATDGILDDYGDSLRAQINTRFDNQIATTRANLVTRGMYNSTVYDSMVVGIERERSLALNDLEDKITKQDLDLKSHVYTVTAEMRMKVLGAYERLMAMKRENALTPLDFRNKILGAMLAFMERRTDDYPGLDGLANLAAQLGFSEGAAVVAPTS